MSEAKFVCSIEVTNEVLDRIKCGDERLFEALYDDYKRFLYTTAKKYLNYYISDIEEVLSICNVGFVKAVNTYNVDNGTKFITYLAVVVNNEIKMFLRKNNRHCNVVSLNMVLSTDEDGGEFTLAEIIPCNETPEKLCIDNNFDEVVNEATAKAIKSMSKVKQQIVLMYLQGVTNQNVIAEASGLTQSYVSRIIKNFRVKLAYNLEKAGYNNNGFMEAAMAESVKRKVRGVGTR